MDAGTYLYNAAPPWDNSLAFTAVHNTLTVNQRNQMTPAGRFLFVDRAQAEVVEAADDRLTARHDGYLNGLAVTSALCRLSQKAGW